RTQLLQGSPLADLLKVYVELQRQHGFDEVRDWQYGYDAFDNGVRIPALARRIYGEIAEAERPRFGNPFRTGPNSFFEWLTQADADSGISPFLEKVLAVRADVAAAFPDARGEHRDAFLQWARTTGVRELRYDPRLMQVSTPDTPA